MQPIADAAATLGGRFNLIFHPADRRVHHHACGLFPGEPFELVAGIKDSGGEFWTLPFTEQGRDFPFVEQHDTLTSIRYRAVHPGIGIELQVALRMPFYPRNLRLSLPPFYYVDVMVRRLKCFRHTEPDAPLTRGELVFQLRASDTEFTRSEDGFAYAFRSHSSEAGEAPPLDLAVPVWVESQEAEPFGEGGLCRAFDLGAESQGTLSVIWSSWLEEPVLRVFGEETTLRYLEVFSSREQMVCWAREERDRIRKRCRLLDESLTGSSLGRDAASLAALAFHSFLADTWWTVREDGSDWFSVWEGNCYYHSTLDVEYNDSLLYLSLWPELLELLLGEWAEFEVDGSEALEGEGKGTAFLCHDMGSHHVVGRQAYPHHMEVEQNCNYLLLLSAWTALTGKHKAAKKHLPLCRRLGEFLVKCDTTGNGLPDQGAANTIDDAAPAMQYGREQTYLAVKTQAALWALGELELACDDAEAQTERWRAFAAKGIKTLESEVWQGDHYAVTLSRTTEGLTDPWTGEALEPGELAGWDDYSIYTTNGLLYLFLSGLRMPRWKLNRFAADIENALDPTMTRYGCRHSSTPGQAVWFSQNIWRDCVAAYLGIDMLNNVERYWDYQLTTGGAEGGQLYYDTTEQNNLAYYPRGAVVFGLLLGAGGLSLNRLNGQLTLRPIRSTLRVPLLPLADWEEMRIPWLSVTTREGVSVARISEPGILQDLTVNVIGAELEPE